MQPDDASEERKQTYQDSLAKHGESPQALKWRSYRAAAQRFKQLVADVHISGKTILDAGCGMGDLLPYLYANGEAFDYLGVDVTPGFIDIAQKRYLGNNFEIADPFADDLARTFDVVFCSGVLNASTPDWQQNRKTMIAKLYGYANEALVFNMAGSFQPASEVQNMGYASIDDILEFCKTLTPKLILRNGYNRKDFTVVLYK